jgi:hypothetical protein
MTPPCQDIGSHIADPPVTSSGPAPVPTSRGPSRMTQVAPRAERLLRRHNLAGFFASGHGGARGGNLTEVNIAWSAAEEPSSSAASARVQMRGSDMARSTRKKGAYLAVILPLHWLPAHVAGVLMDPARDFAHRLLGQHRILNEQTSQSSLLAHDRTCRSPGCGALSPSH